MQQQESRRFSAKYILQYALMLAIAAVLLYFSFKGIKWNEFAEGLSSCRWGWIVCSMLFGIAGFFFRAGMWKMLLSHIDRDSSIMASYHGISIGYMANFVFPRVGELVRCQVVSTLKKNTSFEGAIGTVIVERAWDLLCLLAVTFSFVAVCWKDFGNFFRELVLNHAQEKLSVSFIAIVISVAVALILAATLLFVYRKKIAATKAGAKIVSFFSNMWKGIKSAVGMKHKWKFFLYTFLLWLSFYATSRCTIAAFPSLDGLVWKDAVFLMLAGSFGWALPTQGGIGAYHFIIALAVSQIYGLPKSNGIVFATISHESQALAMILCGAVSLIFYTLHKRNKGKNEHILQS